MSPHPRSADEPSPLPRLAVVAGFAALLSWRGGDRRAAAMARALAAAGLALMSWPFVDASIRMNGHRKRRIDVHSSVEIARAVPEVFDFFKDFENLPMVVQNLTSVSDTQDGRSHWVVRSASGEALEWEAITTKYVPRSVIGFESVPGGPVQVSTTLRFVPLAPDRTRLDVDITYRAMHTDLSDAVFALLSRRPGRRMLTDIDRTRAYLESLPPAPAAGALPSSQPGD